MIAQLLLTLLCLAGSSLSMGMGIVSPAPQIAPAEKPLFSTKYDKTLGNKKRGPLTSITNVYEAGFDKATQVSAQEIQKATASAFKQHKKAHYLLKKEIELKKSFAQLKADLKMMENDFFIQNRCLNGLKKDLERQRLQKVGAEIIEKMEEDFALEEENFDRLKETITTLRMHVIKAKLRLECPCTKKGGQCRRCDIMNLKELDGEKIPSTGQ